jgi:hypothetical protein
MERVVEVALLAMLASDGLVPVWYIDFGLSRPIFGSGILNTCLLDASLAASDDSVAGGLIPKDLFELSVGFGRALEVACPGWGRRLRGVALALLGLDLGLYREASSALFSIFSPAGQEVLAQV